MFLPRRVLRSPMYKQMQNTHTEDQESNLKINHLKN